MFTEDETRSELINFKEESQSYKQNIIYNNISTKQLKIGNLTQNLLQNVMNDTVYFEILPSLKVFFYCAYSIIFFVGLFGNILVCYVVYSNKNMNNVTYYFITNLAMSDIFLCLFSVPITPIYLLSFEYWPFGSLFCHLLPFSQGVSVYISSFTLMSIAIERYFLVIHPFNKKMTNNVCFGVICIIWISGIILILPYSIFMELKPYDTNDENNSKWFCDESWPHETSRRTFSTCTSIIQFIVPFIIIAFCYSEVCSRLNERAKSNLGNARKQEYERERSKRTNYMLILIVIIFVICWLPLNAHNLIVDFFPSVNNWPYIKVFSLLAHVTAMCSTCCNPFVYAWLDKAFRKEFKNILPCFNLSKFKPTKAKKNETNDRVKKSKNKKIISFLSLTCKTKDCFTKSNRFNKQTVIVFKNDTHQISIKDENILNDLSKLNHHGNVNIENINDKQNESLISKKNDIFESNMNKEKNFLIIENEDNFCFSNEDVISENTIIDLNNRISIKRNCEANTV
uniref:G protein-coupled receptor n=1 Tax=Polyphagotarsonemus latus TaxID=1204166 RepID=A0AAN0LM70_9ACAR